MPPPPFLPNIEKSIEANTLWPPVADALGTFVRRRFAGADGYELTWRLVHVWESIAAVLVGAAVSRLRDIAGSAGTYLRCREHLYGRGWDPLSRTITRSQGALDGSANRRIDVLWELDNLDPQGSRFLEATKKFLAASGLNLRHLVSSWKQICDVPPEVTDNDTFTVREAFRHANTFRNRFAHVPFPYDEMAQVANAFAEVTEQLFAIDPKPWQTFNDDRIENPLNGGIECRSRRLRGRMDQFCEAANAEPRFVFPAQLARKDLFTETWDGTPFVYVDSMFRASILTRLISDANGVWEYTRFLAERNSVIRDERPDYLVKLPAPSSKEYPVPAEEEGEKEAVASTSATDTTVASLDEAALTGDKVGFEEALRHIANEEYEPAIEFFTRLVSDHPAYHIGWLRLGHALRELAMRRRLTSRDEAMELFDRSVEALTRAAEHTNVQRQAQALYERSKAYYHRSRLKGNELGADDIRRSVVDAEDAYERTRDTRYETWRTYIYQHGGKPGDVAQPTST